MNSPYLIWLKTKLDSPGYMDKAKKTAIKRINKYYLETSNEELRDKVYAKAVKARETYDEPDYEQSFVDEQIEEELIDVIGWDMTGRYSNAKGH